MKNPPLIYTIALVKFPKVPAIARFIDRFHDAIRDEYPLSDEFNLSFLNADFDSQNVQFTQQETKVWQFTSIDQRWALVLSDQSICLHTNDYQSFADFSDRFKKSLSKLLHISDIGIEWTTMIGLRYVNLVKPKHNINLNAYLQPWVLPTELLNSPLITCQGVYVTSYTSKAGELRLQVLRNPQFTLPPELQSPLIIKNEWIKARPESDFAIVDIDHSNTFTHPTKIALTQTIKTLSSLNQISKNIFKLTGTELSHKNWGVI